MVMIGQLFVVTLVFHLSPTGKPGIRTTKRTISKYKFSILAVNVMITHGFQCVHAHDAL